MQAAGPLNMSHAVCPSSLDSETKQYATKFLTRENNAPGIAYESARSSSMNNQTVEYVTRFLEPANYTSEAIYENGPSSVHLKKRTVDYLAKFSASTTDAAAVAYGKNFVKRQVAWFDKLVGSSRKSTLQKNIKMDVKYQRRNINDETNEVLDNHNTDPGPHQKLTLSNDYIQIIGENDYQNIDNLLGSSA